MACLQVSSQQIFSVIKLYYLFFQSFFCIQLFPTIFMVQVFEHSRFSGSRFFRVQVFQGTGFSGSGISGSRFFRAQVFLGPGPGSESRFQKQPFRGQKLDGNGIKRTKNNIISINRSIQKDYKSTILTFQNISKTFWKRYKRKIPFKSKELHIGKETKCTYSNFSTSTLLITAISGLYDSTYENQNHPFSLI